MSIGPHLESQGRQPCGQLKLLLLVCVVALLAAACASRQEMETQGANCRTHAIGKGQTLTECDASGT
ncbi:hypothetical protein [Bosea sp. (in: a-proteobacteria)]|uniref:hypothetical protein n=1 Tax=Bosea sp. (in: a-proteobacteria) TaxID=1871050 RepID=UPI003F6E881D